MLPCTAAFMALCFKPPHSRRVTAKALGNAWKAIVERLPALAPIALPHDKSKRLRLVEKALRSLFVDTDVSEVLDPFSADWMLLDAIACEDPPDGVAALAPGPGHGGLGSSHGKCRSPACPSVIFIMLPVLALSVA